MPGDENGDGRGDSGSDQQGDGGTSAPSWEAWLEGQPEDVQGLYEEHTKGLRSALSDERSQRGDLAKQLRDATVKLEEGSEARTSLEKMTAALEGANRRADFYGEAARPEIGCVDSRLAWLAAQEIDAFDRRGDVEWERLKKEFPGLFSKTRVAGNAGSGTDNHQKDSGGMNAMIRQAAGRG